MLIYGYLRWRPINTGMAYGGGFVQKFLQGSTFFFLFLFKPAWFRVLKWPSSIKQSKAYYFCQNVNLIMIVWIKRTGWITSFYRSLIGLQAFFKNFYSINIKCGMGPWLVLVSPCFRENVVPTCKIGSFLHCLDNLLQKNVIVLFFWKSNFKMALIWKKGYFWPTFHIF